MKSPALDANIAIDLLNEKKEALEKYQDYPSFYLPVIVCGELLYGALNSNLLQKNLEHYQGFIKTCSVFELDYKVAEQYAIIRKKHKDKGTPIPENDIWIAAACIVNDISLATNDKHFKNIEELKLS